MKRLLLIAAAASISTAAFATGGNDPLWENGNHELIENGYSMLTAPRRTLLDDFTVPEGPGWSVTDFHARYVWNSGVHDVGGSQITFWSNLDNHPNGQGGEKGPGEPFFTPRILATRQTDQGHEHFGRPGQRVDIVFEKFFLAPGKYWIEIFIQPANDNQNNFLLVSTWRQKNPVWLNYEDFPPIQPGRNIFGVNADAIWTLTGKPVPEPMTLLALASGFGILIARRRRK